MAKLQVPEFITEFTDLATKTIAELESGNYPDGDAKKARLDEILTTWALASLTNLAIPFWAKLGIKFLITKYLSVLTQNVYNLIKTKVAGITDNKATKLA